MVSGAAAILEKLRNCTKPGARMTVWGQGVMGLILSKSCKSMMNSIVDAWDDTMEQSNNFKASPGMS